LSDDRVLVRTPRLQVTDADVCGIRGRGIVVPTCIGRARMAGMFRADRVADNSSDRTANRD
jgi:hypothetical protein